MTNTVDTRNNGGGDLVGTTDDRGIYQEGALSKYSTSERDQLRALAGLDEASDGDLDMLAAVSMRTGLDPFLKEIYLVGRKTKVGGYRGEPERWETKWTVQAGIDGFRKVLFRTAEKQGVGHEISAPVFLDADGREHRVWLKQWGYPAAALVDVRLGDSVGHGIATWDEFVQTKKSGEPNSMWDKMGPTMLAKCAEAQGHRKVNSLTSGMYVDEEMLQANARVQASAQRMDQPSRGSAGLRAALEGGASVQDEFTEEDLSEEAARAKSDIDNATDQDQLKAIMQQIDGAFDQAEYDFLRQAGTARWHELLATPAVQGQDAAEEVD